MVTRKVSGHQPEMQPVAPNDASSEVTVQNADPSQGHGLTFIGISLFTFWVYARPYEWSESLAWLSSAAFWIAISTVLVFIPTQLNLGNRLTVLESEVKLVLLLISAALVSISQSLDHSRSWTEFIDYSKVVLIFILMVNVVRTRGRLKILIFIILAITEVLAIAAVRDYVTGNLTLEGVRIRGIIEGAFSNPNDLALHFVTMAPIALSLALGSRFLAGKIFYFVVGLSIMAGVVATASRAGLLGLVVALGVLGWRLARRNKALLLVGLVCFLVIVPVMAGYSDRFSTEEASAVARTDDLKRSILLALYHPLFGIGFNNYVLYSNTAHATHNAYTQVWVETGTPALLLYVAFIVIPLRALRKINRAPLDRRRNDLQFIAVGLEASICGYMVSSFFASVAYLWNVYYLIAFAICIRWLVAESGEPSADVDNPPLEDTDLPGEFGSEGYQANG